jgi:tetratricopeptide (TPR) repeat protein
MKIRPSTPTSIDVHRLIEEARDAELCRNLDLFRDILATFWVDIESEPDVTAFSLPLRAELLRLCGVFLNQFGRARGLDEYQIRAKDILTRAGEFFETQNCYDKAAETKVALANCYWFAGEIAEYDDLIKSVEEDFSAEPGHPVSIQIKLNRLLIANWRGELKEAKYLIDRIAEVITPNHDFRLRTQFHNLAGITFRLDKNLNRSALHLNEAVRIARKQGNNMFLAFNLNNLAMVYRDGGNLEVARQTIEKAISIMESRQDKGWISHALDTKALIYIDQAEHDKALAVIESSIAIFSEGEDHAGFAAAMWTKCLCLLRLGRPLEAVGLFAKLMDLADRQIGKVAVDKFAALFLEEVYPLKKFPLTDELATLKRSLVVKAMRESGNHVSKAARKLGLRSQQHLSDILNNQFPDIYDELGIKRRARRSNEDSKKASEPALGVARLIMPKNRTYSFNFAWRGKQEPQFFYFPRNLMREFGVKTDAVVAVMPVKSESLIDGGTVLYFKDDTFRVGRLSYDEYTQLFLVDLEDFIFLSDVQLIGVPIGYCRIADRNKRLMKFERLQLVK